MISDWEKIVDTYKSNYNLTNILVRGNTSFKSFENDPIFNKLNTELNFKNLIIPKGNVNELVLKDITRKTFTDKNIKYRFFAFGGGAIIDYTKHLVYFALNNNIIVENFIVCPTTAGSGSEMTNFAVLYKKDGTKTSIQNKYFKPNHIYYKYDTLINANNSLLISSGLDSICQSIESMLSKNSTKTSIIKAETSLTLGIKFLPELINERSEFNSKGMFLASRLAGESINITKTTAAHAYSYYLTFQHNIPHGIAVAIILEELISQLKNTSLKNYLRINNFFINAGYDDFTTFLNQFNIDNYKLKNIEENLFLSSVNMERLKNYPFKIDSKLLIKNLRNK